MHSQYISWKLNKIIVLFKLTLREVFIKALILLIRANLLRYWQIYRHSDVDSFLNLTKKTQKQDAFLRHVKRSICGLLFAPACVRVNVLWEK